MTGGLLVCGVNWLGDSVMSMPALQAFRRAHPTERITLLVKAPLAALWRLQGCFSDMEILEEGLAGTWRTGIRLYRKHDVAYILPNSFRSALIPWLARIPKRIGVAGHDRQWLLTQVVRDEYHGGHQAEEYYRILGVPCPVTGAESVHLTLPADVCASARTRLGTGKGPWFGFLPGAARGPSKRWPPEYFIEVGRRLVLETEGQILVLGTAGERLVCGQVAAGIGPHARSLAGDTDIQTLSALLALCHVVVANDSGGMHLAAACGTRVVGIFGITDATKTGPLGSGHKIVCSEGVRGTRKVARDSELARETLRSIRPDRVLDAVRDCLRMRTEPFTGAVSGSPVV